MSKIGWWRTDIGEAEKASILQAFDDRRFTQGPYTARLEKALAEKLGAPYVVMTTSGSIALLMGMVAIGIEPGDEVIVPDQTWIATAHAAALIGGKIVLVDCTADSPLLDTDQVAKSLTKRTKAIVPVHLNGRPCDMSALRALSESRGIALVEDAAQAMFCNSPYGMLGTLGEVGCFSLGMTKLISSGIGGFCVTRSAAMYERLLLVRDHGVTDRMMGTSTSLGFNFRGSDLLSAMGLAQLERADRNAEHVRTVYRRYEEGLAGLSHVRVLPVNLAAGAIPVWTEAMCTDRAGLTATLAAKGIEIHPGTRSLSLSPQLAASGHFPNSRRFNDGIARLPSGPGQPLENVDRVIDAIRSLA